MVPHSVVVDFAVALLFTSIACDCLDALADEADLRTVAFWTLMGGAAAALFAVLSGYSAMRVAAPSGAAEDLVLWHRNLGIALTVVFVPLASWRAASGGAIPARLRAVYWGLTLLGAGLLAVTAYLGGTAVFRHGVGVQL